MKIENTHFILEDGEPVSVTLDRYLEWISSDIGFSKRCVANTVVGDYEVSTIFLGITRPPSEDLILFETLVFRDDEPFDETMQHYETLEDAMLGHEYMVAAVKAGKTPK